MATPAKNAEQGGGGDASDATDSTRNNWGSIRTKGLHGTVDNATPAPLPLWDLQKRPLSVRQDWEKRCVL